jgi:hypothetical protein
MIEWNIQNARNAYRLWIKSSMSEEPTVALWWCLGRASSLLTTTVCFPALTALLNAY